MHSVGKSHKQSHFITYELTLKAAGGVLPFLFGKFKYLQKCNKYDENAYETLWVIFKQPAMLSSAAGHHYMVLPDAVRHEKRFAAFQSFLIEASSFRPTFNR